MIQTKDLQKLYATEEVETTALNDVTMEIKEGEFVAIMGPSLSRATALMHHSRRLTLALTRGAANIQHGISTMPSHNPWQRFSACPVSTSI